MKVYKRTLLLIASIVWSIAGFNVLIIGLNAYKENLNIFNILLSIVVYMFFWFLIFNKLVIKHSLRIKNYQEENIFFLNFFDLKSFIIMFLMITFGFTIRFLNLAPDSFIAFFYTGLGLALFFAGLKFGLNFIKYSNIR